MATVMSNKNMVGKKKLVITGNFQCPINLLYHKFLRSPKALTKNPHPRQHGGPWPKPRKIAVVYKVAAVDVVYYTQCGM
jgi:hypothetical protein